MQIDIIGTENVVKYIEASKLTKFTISRIGTSNSALPIYECIDSDSNANAVSEFMKFASVFNNSTPYKITLFNFAIKEIDENGQMKVKKQITRGEKFECSFILNTNFQSGQTSQQTNVNHQGGFDFAGLKDSIINEISKKQEENAILNEIKELKSKFAELEEEDEEEEKENKDLEIAGMKPDQLTQLFGLIGMLKGNNQNPPAINGDANQDAETKRVNINNAIRVLYKHDKQLDTDLLKLANLAENKPDTFVMLLDMLRKM